MSSQALWMFAAWVIAVVLLGAILTSYHQPFQPPDHTILALAQGSNSHAWRAVHVLSGSCGCSQRIMQRLINRHASDGFAEQVLMIDGEEPYLQATPSLLAELAESGFPVTHIAAKDIPPGTKLSGIPLLIVASPEDKIAYMGGYGGSDQDGTILAQIRFGSAPKPYAVIGCAIGGRLRRAADPFHLKY